MKAVITIATFCLLLFFQRGNGQQANTICEQAFSLGIGDLVEFTQEAYVELPSTTCFSERLNGYWFKTAALKGVIEVEYVSGNSTYAQIQILSGICNNLICIGSNEVKLGERTYFATSVDSAFVFFRSTNFEVANTKFRIRRINAEDNYSCDKPLPINCNELYPIVITEQDYTNNNDERWFSFVGKNEVVSLYFPYSDYYKTINTQVLKSTCRQDSSIAFRLVRSSDYESLNFFGELGVKYFIKIQQTFNSEGVIILKTDCGNAPENYNCEEAEEIETSELINGNDNFSLYQESYSNDHCENEAYRSVWYKIVGVDSIIEVQMDKGNLISVIADSCCGYRSYFYGVEPKFFGEKDIPYYMMVRSLSDDYNYDLQLRVENIPTIANSICTGAIELECSEDFIVDFAQTVGEVYFKIKGDGNLKEIILQESKAPSYAIHYTVRVYAEDCDALDFSNSILSTSVRSSGDKIQFKAEPNQNYTIRIFTYSDLLDTTSWSLNCIPSVYNDDCENAHNVDFDAIVKGSTYGSTFQHFQDDCTFNRNGDVWYVFEGDGNVNTINLISSSKFPLRFDIYTGECRNLTCFGSRGFYSQYSSKNITFRSEENEDYFFVLYSDEPNDSIDYRFQVLTSIPPHNDICSGAYEILCGQEYSDSTDLASPEVFTYSCYNESPGVWYEYLGNGNMAEFELISSSSSRMFVSVFEERCNSNSCVVVNDEIEFHIKNKIYWETEIGKSYFILISNGYNSTAKFYFRISCDSSPPKDDTCQSSQFYQCGDTIYTDNSFATMDTAGLSFRYIIEHGTWAQFLGDGNLYEIDIVNSNLECPEYRIYRGSSCDSLILVLHSDGYRLGSDVFQTYQNEIYSILVYGDGFQDRGTTEYILKCIEPLENDMCQNPKAITCGDSLLIDFNRVSPDFQSCGSGDQNKVWFEINGNGRINHFNVDSSLIYNNYITLYKKDRCDSLVCVEQLNANHRGTYFFFSEIGVDYLISVGGYETGNNKKTWISLSCFNQAPNDYIHFPEDIICDRMIRVDTRSGSEQGDPFCRSFSAKLLWYRFKGNNNILTISAAAQNTYERVFISLLLDQGFGLECVRDYELYGQNDTIEILTYQNIDYLFGFGGGYDGDRPLDSDFNFNCKQNEAADACFSAPILQCGDVVSGSSEAFHPDFHIKCGYMGSGENTAWYKIIGDNKYYEITYSVDRNYNLLRLYQGDCYSPICMANGNSIRFYAESNQEYLLGAYGRDFGDIYDYTLSLSCFDSTGVKNDLCTNAIPIQCGGIYDALFLDATLDEEAGLCGPTNNAGIWYSIVGNGGLMELQIIDKNDYRDVGIKIFKGMNCDEFICFSEGEIDRYNRHSFRTDVNERYFIQILNIDEKDKFCFSITCRDHHTNDICEDAIELTCGSSYNISLGDVFLNDNINDCTSEIKREAVWFKIEGIGDTIYIHDLLPVNQYSEQIIVFSGSCDNCEQLVEYERIGSWIDQHRYYKFYTESNKPYYIPISFKSITNLSYFGFNVSCNRKSDFAHFALCPPGISINHSLIDEIMFSPPDIDFSGIGTNCDINVTSSLDTIFSLGKNIYTEGWFSTDCFGRRDTCIQSIGITNDSILLFLGPSIGCRGGFGKYTVDRILNAENYIWSYSGAGEIVRVTSNEFELKFAENDQGGALELRVIGLGDTLTSSIQISIAPLDICEIVNCAQEYIHIPQELISLGMLPSEINAIFEISTDAIIDKSEGYFFQAGKSIELMPGFQILENGSLNAQIKNCRISE